jgi:uncharacterized protein (UPF0332 family)
MNPRDFLEVADELASGIREADWRTAASRAYYAAFHVCRRLMEQCGFDVPRAEQAHAYLWLRLSNSGQPDIQQAGDNLRNLRTARNEADYDLNKLFAHRPAVVAVEVGTDIVNLLEEAASMPTVLAQITDTIRIYERDVLRQVTWRP